MALVPWKYSNPFVNRKSLDVQHFTFGGKIVEVPQDVQAEIDVDHNTGLRLWDGAYLLSKYIETSEDFDHEFWKEKHCIELGSGCGLVGMVAWLLGANVTLTDTEETLAHTAKCLHRNFENWKLKACVVPSEEKLKLKSLLWGKESCDQFGDKPYDVILGSDIIYQAEAAVLLLETLHHFSSQSTLILIAYKKRGLGEDIFFEKLPLFSLECSTVPRSKYPDDFCKSDYVILSIKRK